MKSSSAAEDDRRLLWRLMGRTPLGSGIARAPTPLLFAVAAVFHAAPSSAMPFAGVDKVDLTIRRSALPNTSAINVHHQKAFDGQRTGVQRRFHGSRMRPAIRCERT